MAQQQLNIGFTVPQRGVFFGIATLARDARARRKKPIAIRRFDSIWVGDSVMAKPRPESIALLGALSAATRRA